ncbi:MAG: protein BatD, partial [Cytophagales bacterium]|nr:protein BatD [Cytophagales bacterium]
MRTTKVGVLCFCFFLLNGYFSFGQEISVDLGPDEIGLNQYFTISIKIENDNIKEHTPFPDIHGFVKRGTSSSSNTSFINGKVTSSHSLIQNYQPTAKGSFELRSFRITVNGKTQTIRGKKIEVSEPVQQRRRSTFSQDPVDNFFGRQSEATEYIDVKADAFLALTTNKSEVYVGEGFTATLAFYVSEANRADMRFFDLGKQLTEIVKKLKPERCWEENFNVENINGEPVTISGKGFTKYKVYQTAFFPLNVQNINFPALDLELIKYNVAKNPSFFGRNRQEDRETFKSRPKTVKV